LSDKIGIESRIEGADSATGRPRPALKVFCASSSNWSQTMYFYCYFKITICYEVARSVLFK